MLLEYFRDYLRGDIDKKSFQQALEFWLKTSSERKLPFSHFDFHYRRIRDEFHELGVELAPKRSRYLLYRGHCHKEHTTYDLSRLIAFKVVVTVRHPLLSVLTTLRRHPQSQHQSLVDDYIAGQVSVLSVPGAFVFCTDLWQNMPEKMGNVFAYLGLPIDDASRVFLKNRPEINKTTDRRESHPVHNYTKEFDHTPAFRSALFEAREKFKRGEMHPLLEPYWSMIKKAGLLAHYKGLGYQI